MAQTHPASTDSRPRVLAILPGFFPSTILTVVKPFLALHRAGYILADISLESWVSPQQIARADVLVLSRTLEPLYHHILATAVALGKPIIYDIDDNLFELPASYQPELAAQAQAWQAQLTRYIQAASLVRVYAQPMLERIHRVNPYVTCVDGPIDWSLVPNRPPVRDSARVKLVYATSRWIQDDLAAVFLPAVEQLLDTCPSQVELFCWGYHPPQLRRYANVHFLDFVHDYDSFFRRFARCGFDIGLAPLRDEVFYRSKSNNKFREYAACHIAGVYSDVGVYAACVEDGRTGLLVENTPDAWFNAIRRLVEAPQLRQTIQDQAFRYARQHYSLEKMQAEWLEHIRTVQAMPPPASDGQPSLSNPPPAPLNSQPWTRVRHLLSRLPRLGRRGLQLLSSFRHYGFKASYQRVQKSVQDMRTLGRIKWALRSARQS